MKTIYHNVDGHIEEEFIETESMPVVFAIYEDGKEDFVRLFSNRVAAEKYVELHIGTTCCPVGVLDDVEEV